MKISGYTKAVAIFGDPVEHSLSPAMHNAAFKTMKMDYVYVPFHVKPKSLGAAVKGIKAMGLAGANITVPHKEKVIKFLDEIDDEAARLGAVNTIVNRDGKLVGYNTDGRGLIRSLKEDAGFDPAMKRVYLCGAGGAARAIAFSLVAAGARRVYVFDVDGGKMDGLVMAVNSAFGKQAARPAVMDPDFIKGSDLVINATPLGMRKDDPMPMPKESFRPGQVVYDIVYNPPKTKTLKAAETAGAKAVNGLGMLLYQGVFAFEHWTGKTPPADVMRAALFKGF